MIRALHLQLGIPADVLLQGANDADAEDSHETVADFDWAQFPTREMEQRGWIPKSNNLPLIHEPFSGVRAFFDQIGGPKVVAPVQPLGLPYLFPRSIRSS